MTNFGECWKDILEFELQKAKAYHFKSVQLVQTDVSAYGSYSFI